MAVGRCVWMGGSCLISTTDLVLVDKTGWHCTELSRGLSWSSAACEFQWDLPVAYLCELWRNHQVVLDSPESVRYFPAHPTPSSFSTSFPPHLHIFLFTLSPISDRCGWTCSPGFQRQRPHIWTSFVAVNPNPALTHESQLHWTNTNSAVSCLLMDNKTIMRDQTWVKRQAQRDYGQKKDEGWKNKDSTDEEEVENENMWGLSQHGLSGQ